MIMLSRARYCWPGSNYPVTRCTIAVQVLQQARRAPQRRIASGPAEPRSPLASFLSGVNPVPGSRLHLSRGPASDQALSRRVYAAPLVIVSSKEPA